MARELLLLRHGNARKGDGDDLLRELKDKGKRGAQRIGVWLAGEGLIPDWVVSSPAVRALETARKTCKAMGLTAADVRQDERIYQAKLKQLLQVLADCPTDARRVLLVGHNPGLERLLERMVSRWPISAEAVKGISGGTLVRLELPDDWQRLEPGCATLLQLTRPASLPERFPYDGPSGREWRDRPAYYYTQSSVIPYRLNGRRLEILAVASSSHRHWVVPKGICDPGMTPWDSAAKEALEEAGIEGEVLAEPLGVYRQPKWGSHCEVTVYPMRVTRMLAESEWAESHRGRRWLSVAEAQRGLKQLALLPLIHRLEQQLLQGG